jgi:hypothetical protein
MLVDIEEQLLTRIKCNPKFALKINKSTDVAGLADLGRFYIVSVAFREMYRE